MQNRPDADGAFDPTERIAEVRASTDRLIKSIERLGPEDLAAPSLLPSWTRGHVCAHVDGNADSLVNLLTSARTGEQIPQYASAEARDAAIEAGSTRTPAQHLAAVRASADRLEQAATDLPREAWQRLVTWRGGRTQPATGVLWARVQEVEIHHVDLGLSYAPAHWTPDFSSHVLGNATSFFRSLQPPPPFDLHAVDTDARWQLGPDPAPVVVSGAQAALLAWLIGRSSGDGLTVEGPHGHEHALPVPPPWM